MFAAVVLSAGACGSTTEPQYSHEDLNSKVTKIADELELSNISPDTPAARFREREVGGCTCPLVNLQGQSAKRPPDLTNDMLAVLADMGVKDAKPFVDKPSNPEGTPNSHTTYGASGQLNSVQYELDAVDGPDGSTVTVTLYED